jgi:glycosyltransferase involved in cell wall biosynthesis
MKILYLVTEDWYFYSHRLPIACAAVEQGYEVVVATRVQKHGEAIAQKGIKIIPIRLRRRSKSPFNELFALIELCRIYYHERPDLVHHVSLKPVIYGSIAALLARKPKVVNAVAGLGFVFTSQRLLAKLLRPFITFAFRLSFNRSGTKVIVQNPDDRALLINKLRIREDHVHLIRGSGVNIANYRIFDDPAGEITIALISRMLWDKGIGEYIAAIEQLKSRGLQFRALLVGEPDDENPASVAREQLAKWHAQGNVEYLGYIDDVPQIWAKAHIAVLPSFYGEGVPKSLLEAASCGRPIVTTDMPGCREIVHDSVNGLLVPPRNVDALADAIAELIENPERRKKMGLQGRELVEREFSEQKILPMTLSLYSELLQ